MASHPAVEAQFSSWSWDVEADVVSCLPGLFAMHAQPWPPEATDPATPVSMPRARWLDVVPEGQRDRVLGFCEAILEEGIGGELTYPVASGGEVRWLLLQASVGESDAGGVRRVFGYTRDVTTDKLLRVAQDRAQRDLQQQQQVLDRIAAGGPLEETLALLCRHVEWVYPGVLCAIMLHDKISGVLRTGAAPSLSRDHSDATEWSYPLRGVTDTVLGTIVIYRNEPFGPAETQTGVISRVGHLAALAIERDSVQAALQTSSIAPPAAAVPNRRVGDRKPVKADPVGGEAELRRAIEADELVVHYQPILDIANRRWDRFEALVRWNHPTRGLLAPAEFVPLAERSGLISLLGQRVLEMASRDGARWVASVPGLRVAVNISVLQLDDPNFVDDTVARLEQAGLAPSSVDLQIPESGVIQRLDSIGPVLEQLQGHSLRVVVDDFGSGYSALARMGQLAITSLKIERRFISALSTDMTARTLVRSIVAVARAHGLSVVAKGVEDADTLAAVEELGCDHAQGFFLAEPAPAEDVLTMKFEAGPPRLRLVGSRSS